jgi:hypothetical protein
MPPPTGPRSNMPWGGMRGAPGCGDIIEPGGAIIIMPGGIMGHP